MPGPVPHGFGDGSRGCCRRAFIKEDRAKFMHRGGNYRSRFLIKEGEILIYSGQYSQQYVNIKVLDLLGLLFFPVGNLPVQTRRFGTCMRDLCYIPLSSVLLTIHSPRDYLCKLLGTFDGCWQLGRRVAFLATMNFSEQGEM